MFFSRHPTTKRPSSLSPEHRESPPKALEEIAGHLLASDRPIVIARPSAARGRAGGLLERLAVQLGVQAVITGPPRGLADSKYIHLAPSYTRSDCALVIGPSDYSLGFLDESIVAAAGKICLSTQPAIRSLVVSRRCICSSRRSPPSSIWWKRRPTAPFAIPIGPGCG